MPAVTVESLTKEYAIGRGLPSLRGMFGAKAGGRRGAERFFALKDVSFEVRAGEALGIIGRNGAGKSTLLKILSRITEPTSGRAVLDGRTGSLLEVGTGFHPELTGRENVYLNGAILGMRRGEIDRKFDEIVAFSGIEKFIDTPVKRYSSGMYVRLAFAVAAHLEPEILIVDEVLAVGDAEFQKKCLAKMGDVATAGRTILFVSHNMMAIDSLCSRALWIKDGRIAASGAVGETLGAYFEDVFREPEAPVSERVDRKGTGAAKVTSFAVGAEGDSAGRIRCSTRIRFRIGFSGERPRTRYAFVAGIVDSRGVPLYWLDSRYGKALPDVLPESGEISCVTAPVNLIPGAYSVNVALLVDGEVADQVEAAASFVVEPENFFGAGRLPERQHGICLLSQDWTMGGRP